MRMAEKRALNAAGFESVRVWLRAGFAKRVRAQAEMDADDVARIRASVVERSRGRPKNSKGEAG